jgi:hypothetical protein
MSLHAIRIPADGMKTNAFHRPAFSVGLLGQFVRDCFESLDFATLAVAQGRALDELRDRLVGSFGIQELMVDESIARDRSSANKEVIVYVITSKRIAADASSYHINKVVANVNRRHETQLRAQIVERTPFGAQPSTSRSPVRTPHR